MSTQLSDLIGKTMTAVEQFGREELRFTASDGSVYKLYHEQDCCESVEIEEVVGDLGNLVGAPITMADESSSTERPSDLPAPEYPPDSQTWTFYKFATRKGYVDVRWLGESNGYYSENVDFAQVSPPIDPALAGRPPEGGA